MITLSQCQKVFNGEGFLSNDPGYGSPYRKISHISKENPIKLLNRIRKDEWCYYEKEKLSKLINLKVDISEDKYYILNEFTGTIINSVDELYQWIKNDYSCYYVEYAR